MSSQPSQGLDYRKTVLPSQTILHIWKPLKQSAQACIVLQHGFTEYAERFLQSHQCLIPKLCSKRCMVFAMDLWGHGRSPGSGQAVTHISKAVDDHVRVRQIADSEHLPIFLLGFSLGGLITAASYTKEPSLGDLKGVILMYPALQEPVNIFAEVMVNIGSWLMPKSSIPVRGAAFSEHSRDPEQVEALRKDTLVVKRQVPFLLAATALSEAGVVWGKADRWMAPTLVMHGTADTATSHEASERFVGMIASSDKMLRTWDGGRHELLNDIEGQEVACELLDWISARISR